MPFECPCAESSTSISTLELTSSATLSSTSGEPPIAAATKSLPLASLALLGYCMDFSISFMVIRPLRYPFLSTMGSFSILCLPRIFCASSNEVPTGAVTRLSFVITLDMGCSKLVSKRKSRLVSMPTSLSFSVIGTPLILYFAISSHAAETGWSGVRWNGSVITPCSLLLTLSTCKACSSIVIFL